MDIVQINVTEIIENVSISVTEETTPVSINVTEVIESVNIDVSETIEIVSINVTEDVTLVSISVTESSSGGAVDSVNGQTGVVVLSTSDLEEDTDHNYVTDAQQTVIENTSGTNTGDQESGDFDHGALQNTHNLTTDINHGSITNTHNLTTDIDHNQVTNTHNLTTDIDHGQITNTHNLTTDIDHNQLTNYEADEHFTQSEISIPASQVNDFDTEVSNNTDVAANTSARHDAVTVTDTPEIDLTLTGQDLQAAIVASSIDETKLDASVNSSLDLADNALQSSDIGATVQAHSSVLDNTTASYTTAEETKLSGIEALAEVNNISDADATDLTDGGETILHTHSQPYIHLLKLAAQTLSAVAGAVDFIDWDVEYYKDDIYFSHDNVTNNTRIYVDEDGRYSLYWNIIGTHNTSIPANISDIYRINGTTIIFTGGGYYNRTNAELVRYGENTEVDLSADDYIEAGIRNSTGTVSEVLIAIGCELIMRKIG